MSFSGETLSLPEAAAALGVSLDTLALLVKRGQLHPIHPEDSAKPWRREDGARIRRDEIEVLKHRR